MKYSTSAHDRQDSADVINKVRDWLNAWRPDHDNIQITARRRHDPMTAADGTKEAYEIEIIERRGADDVPAPAQRAQQHQVAVNSSAMACDSPPTPAASTSATASAYTTAAEEPVGAPASDLPAFVSEVSNMSQGM